MKKMCKWKRKVVKQSVFLLLGSCFFSAQAQQDTLRHAIGINYEHTHFSKQFAEDWRIASVEYKQKTNAITLIGKVNVAQRFGQKGIQAEAQAYPKFSRRVYAFVGASYSNNNPVFPGYTTGATLYVGLNGGWEVEGGYRQLKFTDQIWVGSGGVSKYFGNWLFNLTSYISIQTPADNQSYFFTAKRFFADSREVFWIQAGSGVSPDERRNIQLTTANLRSKRLNAGAKFFVWKNTLLQLTGGYSKDEFREKTFGNQWNGLAGFAFLF